MPDFASIVLFVFIVAAVVLSMAWLVMDARRRGRNWVLPVVLCLLTWPLGHVVWLAIRPPHR